MKPAQHPADVIGDAVAGWRAGVNKAHPGAQIREAMKTNGADGVNRYLAIACFPSVGLAVAIVTCEYRGASAELRIVTHDLSPTEAVLGRPGRGVPFEDLPEPFRSIATAASGATVRVREHGDYRTQEGR